MTKNVLSCGPRATQYHLGLVAVLVVAPCENRKVLLVSCCTYPRWCARVYHLSYAYRPQSYIVPALMKSTQPQYLESNLVTTKE